MGLAICNIIHNKNKVILLIYINKNELPVCIFEHEFRCIALNLTILKKKLKLKIIINNKIQSNLRLKSK